jgi:hypothetical protein
MLQPYTAPGCLGGSLKPPPSHGRWPSSLSRRRHKRHSRRHGICRDACRTVVSCTPEEGDQRIGGALHWIIPRNNDPRLTLCTDQGGPDLAQLKGPIATRPTDVSCDD